MCSPIRAHGTPARCRSEIRRCRRSCGENDGTPAAVHARAIAVRRRSAVTPWKTRRSGMRSSRGTRSSEATRPLREVPRAECPDCSVVALSECCAPRLAQAGDHRDGLVLQPSPGELRFVSVLEHAEESELLPARPCRPYFVVAGHCNM